MKEDIFEDAVADDTDEMLPENSSNDTNDDDLYYFTHMTNHYLRLVKVSPHLNATSRHKMRFPIIADSGANSHMFKEVSFLKHFIQQMVELFLVMEKPSYLSRALVPSSVKLETKIILTVYLSIGETTRGIAVPRREDLASGILQV